MNHYKICWSKSNLSKSENKSILKEIKGVQNLSKAIHHIKEKSRFNRYSDLAYWFYLNGIEIKRTDPSGNKFSSEIKFSPCYFQSSRNLKNSIRKALTKDPHIKEKYSRLERKIEKNQRLPLTAVLESCEILEKDFWNHIEGEMLAGETSPKYIEIPEETPKLEKMTAWIVTEGHLPISHPSIEINQLKSEAKTLQKLAEDFKYLFKCNNLTNFSSTSNWSGEKGERMIVSSAAVRQFFALKYSIPIGKKSKNIEWDIETSRENYLELLSAFIKSEGSINSSNGQTRFEFKIQDECIRNCCHNCLEMLNCEPQKSKTEKTFNTGVYSFNGLLKLHHFAKNTIEEEKLAKKIQANLNPSKLSSGLRNHEWCELVKNARKELKSSSKNQAFAKKHNHLFPNSDTNQFNVSNWALGNSPPPLSAAITSLKILDQDYEKIFPEHLNAYINSSSHLKYVES